MIRVVVLSAPHDVRLVEEPEPRLRPAEVRVETLYSGISAGTELTQYRGTNPYLHKRWDAARLLFVEGGPELSYPLAAWGYGEVGRVVDRGIHARDVDAGALIWGAWGHRSGAAVAAERAARRLLPVGVSPLVGVFARIGAVALNAVLDAAVEVGSTVAVFGLGVPGLIAVQLAARAGATVVAVDRVPNRLDTARALGAAHALDAAAGSPAEAIKDITSGRGADVTIDLSGSYEALHEAVRATAANSCVVAAGFYQGGGAALRLGEEFHHNRIRLVASQIGSTSPGLAHRWDRTRLEATVLRLAAEGALRIEPLVSHIVPAERAADAFRLLDEGAGDALQVVLDFGAR